jgi:hypothetical protein
MTTKRLIAKVFNIIEKDLSHEINNKQFNLRLKSVIERKFNITDFQQNNFKYTVEKIGQDHFVRVLDLV